jgi:hypothetical protein
MHDDELISLSDVKIGVSPLSGEMYLFSPDEKGLASNKKPCEHELMFALVGHMMHDSEDACAVEKNIQLEDQWYTIRVEKIYDPEDIDAEEEEE